MSVEAFAEHVRQARRIAVLSGAGISTPSGIPDFRSPTGLYSTASNANVFDIDEFRRNPAHFYEFAHKFHPLIAAAQPNVAHRVLAKWEKAGKDVQIATQNIDDLHQRAGSTHVYPVHGTMATSTCQGCYQRIESRQILPEVMEGKVPRCACGGVYKPDVTFFGELLPDRAWQNSARAMSQADLVIVIGTSLVVQPAASLPEYRPPSAKLVIVNRDETHLDGEADWVSHDPLEQVFGEVESLT